MPSKQMWAIVGVHGLYVGTWQRRIDAIAGHVRDMRHVDEPETPDWPAGGGGYRSALSPQQSKVWRRRQQAGDRAVKVTVTWE